MKLLTNLTPALRAFCAAAAIAAFGIAAPAGAQQAEELRVLKLWELQTLDLETAGFDLRSLGVIESLVATTEDGQMVPALAEAWTVSDDGLTWDFTIRDNAVFHDGTAVTGEAVAASYIALKDNARLLKDMPIGSVSSEGQTVTFTLTEPFGSFLPYLLDPTGPVLAPASFADGAVTVPVATGPFAINMAATELPRSVMLRRHDGYWGDLAQFEQARVDFVGNPETRVNIALAGEADVIPEIPASSVARINASGVATIEQVVMPRHVMLMLNAGEPQFETPDLRRAMSLAIDRRAIAAAVFGDPGLAATQYFPPVAGAWHLDTVQELTYDPGAANAVLDAAGWVRGEDGIRTKDGVRFAGSIRTFPERAYLPVICEILQQQFAEIGYELTLDVGDWSRIPEGQSDGSLDLGLGIRTMMNVTPDPIVRLQEDFASDAVPPGATGATNWSNQEIRDAVTAYLASSDEEARAGYRETILQVLHDELPVIPIVWTAENFAISTRVGGFRANPLVQDWRLNLIGPAE